jgi:BCD family chlorophyll transporter-like MFS transporter
VLTPGLFGFVYRRSSGYSGGEEENGLRRNSIIRLSLVRFATSFLVVLIVGVLNRIMIVELGIARSLVGIILSVLHLATPLALFFGHLSDRLTFFGLRRTPYIIGGMVLCAAPVPFLPMLASGLSENELRPLLIAGGVLLLLVMGFGITISTVAVHALIVDSCPREFRGEAMTVVWIITLAGFILASPLYAALIPDYTQGRLQSVFTWSAVLALAASFIAVAGQERRNGQRQEKDSDSPLRSFMTMFKALGKVPQARRVFLFIALTDLFFFSQEYVLEAFGKELHDFSLSQTTSFSMYLGAGMLISMVIVNAVYSIVNHVPEKRILTIGLIFLAVAFGLLVVSIAADLHMIIMPTILLLGVGKGIYNVGIARTMMLIAREDLSGMLMGLWAVVGGISMGVGELGGAIIVDLASSLTASPALGYAILFSIEGIGLFICVFIILPFNPGLYHDQLNSKVPQAALSPDIQ